MKTILTCGHGNASTGDLITLLRNAEVTLVVDVRSKPYSRYNPQHNRPALSYALSEAGIGYLWKGSNLGGLGENVHFDQTVKEVAALAKKQTIALMCSETAPDRCHRRTMLAPAFEAAGLQVVHLLHDGPTTGGEPHTDTQATLF